MVKAKKRQTPRKHGATSVILRGMLAVLDDMALHDTEPDERPDRSATLRSLIKAEKERRDVARSKAARGVAGAAGEES